MLGSRPIFCICCRNPKNARGNASPHFPKGPKMKVVKIKTKHAKRKILPEDEKHTKTPM